MAVGRPGAAVSGRPRSGEGPTSDLASRITAGDRKAAARLISLIENGDEAAEAHLKAIVPHTGHAHIVGITGPAGSGKSTLVWRLVGEYRARGKRVGVVAVDPSSPFTGGAVLGDRVRMQDLALDRGVFIRSMASRGALGGLARATADVVKVLDAYGSDVVLIETVGAGQDEVDIARTAHTTVVVQVPGMGDEIQAIKAGILEIGDVFAVNKSDRVRADMAVSEIRMMIESGTREPSWVPPIVKTVATSGQGVGELADAVDRHIAHLKDSGELATRLAENAERELVEATRQRFIEEMRSAHGEEFERMVEDVTERRIDARSAARRLVEEFRDSEGSA